MARYEIGAIYEIEAGEKIYYARLLNCDVYGIFEPIIGELSEEVFENTAYRLYISTGTYAVKRGLWKKLLPSPDKTDIERWSVDPSIWLCLHLGILRELSAAEAHLINTGIRNCLMKKRISNVLNRAIFQSFNLCMKESLSS